MGAKKKTTKKKKEEGSLSTSDLEETSSPLVEPEGATEEPIPEDNEPLVLEEDGELTSSVEEPKEEVPEEPKVLNTVEEPKALTIVDVVPEEEPEPQLTEAQQHTKYHNELSNDLVKLVQRMNECDHEMGEIKQEIMKLGCKVNNF